MYEREDVDASLNPLYVLLSIIPNLVYNFVFEALLKIEVKILYYYKSL